MAHIHGTGGNQPLSSAFGKPFSFQNGKILYVKVHKLMGDDVADVSANGRRFMARLETPIKPGERHWVEVKQTEDGVSLQLIRTPNGEGDGEGIAFKLLQHLSITSKEKEMSSFIMELVKNKIPIHKDMLVFAEKYLKGDEASMNVKVLVEMARKNLPFTDRTFLSMKSGEKGDFISMLDTLKIKLSETGRDSRTLQMLQKMQEPIMENVSENLVIKALARLADNSRTFSTRLGHFDLLKSLGFFSSEMVMHQWKEGLTRMVLESYSSLVEGNRVHHYGKLPNHSEESLLNELNQYLMVSDKGAQSLKTAASVVEKWVNVLTGTHNTTVGDKNEASLSAAKQLYGLSGREKQVEMNFTKLKQMWGKSVPASNQEKIFQILLHETVEEFTQQIRGDEMAKVLKKVIGQFGINFEAQFHKGLEIQGQTLKEHLIGLSQHHTSSDIRQLADDIVLKMNHQVLQSQDHTPFLTIVQQFPLYLFGRSTDITIQWTGKETDKGVIDEDYCRVLFYLNLERLNETLIDMQVQNRVISLTVWNEHPAMEALSQSYVPNLRNGLEMLEYQLSNIKFKVPDTHSELSNKILGDQSNRTYSGVDVKV
ncbi:hypothetical protein LCL96_09560 [Rossellomorea aquimaris]|uniref:hypothetical protein n=1 Tax=Rossellomorea aquimaris TaxID=189382 RepID=UPI001CD5AEB0|nr:hypothetical protein [Rossellomorea aquimaris]MCA1059184.1 hypothetical protein [Rossellomorea aquimaris]